MLARLTLGMGTEAVVDPAGHRWVVRRRWVRRRLRWRGKSGRSFDLMDGSDLASLGADLPVVGVVFVGIALLLFAVGAVILVVPAIVFLAELLLIAAVVGVGLAGRMLLGRPWTVEAMKQDTGDAYEWKVRGWRASGELRESIAQQLQATGQPTGGTPVLPDSNG
jgi:hypothetical protein